MADVDLNELERYLKIYQENPDSRVFAPLADLYRRLGRLREAEEICREGIRRHPYYAGGRVALAQVLLDKDDNDAALEEAESVVTYYPDNLLARKILIRALGKIGELDKAARELDALKFIAPAVANDPELLKSARGEIRSTALPKNPGARHQASSDATVPVIAVSEFKTPQVPNLPSDLENLQRMRRSARNMKQKLILEKLIEGLSS